MYGAAKANRGEARGEAKGEAAVDLLRKKLGDGLKVEFNVFGRDCEGVGLLVICCHVAGEAFLITVMRDEGRIAPLVSVLFAALNFQSISRTVFSRSLPDFEDSFRTKSSSLSVRSSSSSSASCRIGKHR